MIWGNLLNSKAVIKTKARSHWNGLDFIPGLLWGVRGIMSNLIHRANLQFYLYLIRP